MLVIRLQRTGRKGHAQFRVVVQDSRRTPTSGRIVAALGSYNPHAKTTILDKEKAALYLSNGAQPSERVARLLKTEGVKLPSWVKIPETKERAIRNPEKLRKNRPVEEVEPVVEETPVAEAQEVDTSGTTEEAGTADTEPTEEKPEEVSAAADKKEN